MAVSWDLVAEDDADGEREKAHGHYARYPKPQEPEEPPAH